MAKLINTLNEHRRHVTPGERRFAKRLETLLEDDYLCWYDVPLGPSRLHPDFVILHPRRGLLFLEVKDWKLESIRRIDKISVEIHGLGGVKSVPNPLEQARHYAHHIVDQLKRDPQLCEDEGRYQGRLSFPYGYGVVLSNITRRQFDALLSEEEQDQVLPGRLVICKDEMTESADAMAFQERLWGMFQYNFKRPLTLPQIDRIRWHLFPEIRIELRQGMLFSEEEQTGLEPSASPQTIPELVRVMDLQQERLARNLGGGHRVIHGVAGSGKTMILGYRCALLAEILRKPILVLCFNVALAAWLRSFIAQRHLSGRVNVHHFHEWCGEQLKTYHIELPETVAANAPLWERQVEAVIQGVDAGRIPRGQYGAILIDEGHDFEPEWLKIITQMVDPETDSLLLLYDDVQSIYRKSKELNFSLASVGIKAAGRTTILRLNYRNTREIHQFVREITHDFLDGETSADDDHIPRVQPESAGASGPIPIFRQLPSMDEEIRFAVRCIKTWHQRGDFLGDVGVVCARREIAREVALRLAAHEVPHLLMVDQRGKRAYDPRKDRVNLLTIQSSKGLEFRSVIFIGLGQIDSGKMEPNQAAKLIHVGMTRATERLLVTASGSNVFTEKLSVMTP